MNVKVSTLLFLITITGFIACKKNSDAPQANANTARLNVINASADTVNFYMNGTRLNNGGNLYPAGSSGYFYVYAGTQNYQLKNRFDTVTNLVKPLFTYPLKLDSGAFASLFIAGTTADAAFAVSDDLLQDTTVNTAFIRFVNASPDAGTLDMYVGDTVKFTSFAFKQASYFKLVGVSGLKPVSIYRSGTSTPILSTHINIATGNSYTFYTKGLQNGKGNSAFGIGITLNVN